MVLEYEIIYSEITGIQFSGIVLKEGIWCVATEHWESRMKMN